MWARQRFFGLRKNAAATIIQKHVRGFVARRKYQRNLKSIVVCQSAVRRWFARKELKKLKIEAKSVEHVKKLIVGLENKIISLQQKIEELVGAVEVLESEKRLLLKELSAERAAYQRLLRENARLEQRYENLCEHIQSDSDLVDVTLVLKLQQKLKTLEAEKGRLEKRLEDMEDDETPEDKKIQKDTIRLQDLEMENSKLKGEIVRMKESLAKEDPNARSQDLLDQFSAMQEELVRRREECIQLRTVLADSDPQGGGQRPPSGELINEDGELLMAFETQKVLIRQLESEIQAEKSSGRKTEEELRYELHKLQQDNERQQKVLSQNLKKTPQAQTEAILQHEINHLTEENVEKKVKKKRLQIPENFNPRRSPRLGKPGVCNQELRPITR